MTGAPSKLVKSVNAGRAPQSDHPGDLYDSSPCAVHALLKVEKLPHLIWEPACGTGNIVKVLRDAGHAVIATDITARGCPKSKVFDFLQPYQGVVCDAIVTNPPYSLAQQFIELGLQRAPLVMMLLRLAFLESTRRAPILDTGLLARVHVFANRLPFMHRANFTGPKSSSAIAFAWFVFSRDHKGPTTIDRIRWEP